MQRFQLLTEGHAADIDTVRQRHAQRLKQFARGGWRLERDSTKFEILAGKAIYKSWLVRVRKRGRAA